MKIDKGFENNKIETFNVRNYNLGKKEFLRFGFKTEDSYNNFLNMIYQRIEIERNEESG